jgi:hypothetical protein
MLHGFHGPTGAVPKCKQMHPSKTHDLFDKVEPIGDRHFFRFKAVVLAVLVGASLTLMVKDDAPGENLQVTVLR